MAELIHGGWAVARWLVGLGALLMIAAPLRAQDPLLALAELRQDGVIIPTFVRVGGTWRSVTDADTAVWSDPTWHLETGASSTMFTVVADTTVVRPEGYPERRLLTSGLSSGMARTLSSRPLHLRLFESMQDAPPSSLLTLVAEHLAAAIDTAAVGSTDDACDIGSFEDVELLWRAEVWSSVRVNGEAVHRVSIVPAYRGPAPVGCVGGRPFPFWAGWITSTDNEPRISVEAVGVTDGPHNPKDRQVIRPDVLLETGGRVLIHGFGSSYGGSSPVLYHLSPQGIMPLVRPRR